MIYQTLISGLNSRLTTNENFAHDLLCVDLGYPVTVRSCSFNLKTGFTSAEMLGALDPEL